MFKQGRRPALLVAPKDLGRFHALLTRAGYEVHTGPRFERKGEVGAWTTELEGGRHVHVQEVLRTDRKGRPMIAVYAHTEAASGFAHLLSALTDGHSFAAGSRKLRRDLRTYGWRVREP